jgi:hypothetical protein
MKNAPMQLVGDFNSWFGKDLRNSAAAAPDL